MANKVSFIIQLKDQFGNVAGKIRRQFAKIKVSADRANRSIASFSKKTRASLRSAGASAAKTGAVMTATLTTPILLMGKSMLSAASDAVETGNKFNAVFSDVKDKANQVADDFSKSFGVAGSTSRKMLSDTGDLLVGFGFTGDAALEMADKVARLSSDLTSFQNFAGGSEAANAALTKALLGETESAKSLGIVIRQTTKEFRDNVASISKARGISLQQAKAIEILRIATKQSQKAVGDVTKTWDDYASVVRRNGEVTKEFSESFGKLMIPMATKLTNKLTKLVDWVTKLSPGMKKIVLVVAGFVAIGGPLLLILGGIAAAFSVISLPVLAVGAAILAAIVISNKLALVLKSLAGFFSEVWVVAKSKLIDFVNSGIIAINQLLRPINKVSSLLGFGNFNINTIKTADVNKSNIIPFKAPEVPTPTRQSNGVLNGKIVVSATQGSKVEQASVQQTSGEMNVGLNMVAQ